MRPLLAPAGWIYVESAAAVPAALLDTLGLTVVREIAQLGGDVSKFVFPSVEKWLQAKITQMGG